MGSLVKAEGPEKAEVQIFKKIACKQAVQFIQFSVTSDY